MKSNYHEIIETKVLRKINDIFPNNIKPEIDTHIDMCVNVKYRFQLPDDPTKPPETKHRLLILKFYTDFIDDHIDPDNISTHKYYDIVIARLYNHLKFKYSEFQNLMGLEENNPFIIKINSIVLNLTYD